MKRSLLIFFVFVFVESQAQNMISNGDFETYTALPSSPGQLSLAGGWYNCNGGGSPDYFHTNGSGIVKLPNCFIGTVNAHSGNACVGGALWYDSPANFREYFSTVLLLPMVIGKTYSVSFYISNGNTAGTYGGGGVDQVSVLFSMGTLTQTGTAPINRTPQYIYPGVFYSHTWQQMSFQFVADSAYQVLTIGNFKSDAASNYQQFDPCTSYGAYYFLDDIIVEALSSGLPPVPAFTSSDTAFCNESGQCIDFTDHSTGSPTTWQWLFPGAVPDTSTMQNPTGICYYSPGTYAVTLIVSNANGSDTMKVSPMITFGSGAALPVLTLKGDTIFSSHASAYQWYYNGSPIPGVTDSFYVVTGDGNYNVYISDSIGCSRLGDGIVITDVNELDDGERMSIFPNPAKDQFRVYGSQFTHNAVLQVYTIFGEKVFTGVLNNKQETIDCKPFPPGIYIVEVSNGHSVYRIRLLKE